MNLFQAFALLVIGCLLVVTVVAALRGWATRREGLIWLSVWLAASVAIIWPDVTGAVAKRLGIGRGADLVLYCVAVVMMIGFLMVYVRLRRLRREMTLLVRHLAIRDAVVTSRANDTEKAPLHGDSQDEPSA